MIITLERFGLGLDSTQGELAINRIHQVWTLEDERRLVKVPGETCIPESTYRLGLRTHGGLHERYSHRFADIHEGMIEVLGVRNFTDILFHAGNDAEDTRGCILPGMVPGQRGDGEFYVGRSADGYRKIYERMLPAVKRGHARLEVTVRGRVDEVVE